MKQSRDPYNKIGLHVLRELIKRRETYGYACYWK